MDGAGKNYIKTIRSRNGVQITLDDTDGKEMLTLQTPAGQSVTLQDSPASITIQDSNGNSLKMEAAGITLTTSGKITLNASTAEVSSGSVNVNAGMSAFSGVVQSPTVLADSVVGTSYTPGAGNMW